MFTHMLIGTLILALVCFTIGRLAGGPDLVSRRRRSRKTLNPPSGTVKAVATTELPSSDRPVIQPTQITRANMRIEP